jgi:hypothetical protein
VAKNIFEAFGGRGIFLDQRFEPDTIEGVRELLEQLVAEADEDARQEIVDDVVAILEGKPAAKPKEAVEASHGVGNVARGSFVEHCKSVARQSR